MIRLAVIGLGARVAGMLMNMRSVDPDVRIVAVADPGGEPVRQRLAQSGMPESVGVQFFDSPDALLEHADQYDGVCIGTRCHLHTPYAMKVAPTGLPLFLEKPVAITEEQLLELARAFRGREESVVVSFPLRVTPLFTTALKIVRSGRLGRINQIQAFNNVNYGGVYFGEWYRNYDEVGGLWLQKATHDFDYLTRLLDDRPTAVAATITRMIYGGEMPHDLRCSRCDRVETCPESPKFLKLRGDGGGMGIDDHWCAFSREIKNEDAGSALIQYASGAHVSYSQNFITRKSAGTRGAIVTGYDATLEFDWYTDEVRVVDHFGATRVDRIAVQATTGHSGGDSVLAQMFLDIIRGRGPSGSDLKDGLLSAAMCLAARRSSHTNTFQPIPTVAELSGTIGGSGDAHDRGPAVRESVVTRAEAHGR